jgi:hypothetical protein
VGMAKSAPRPVVKLTRVKLRELAELRVDDATALLSVGRWEGAYYLAGYAIECALRACIAKLTNQDDFPDKKSSDYYIHELFPLLNHAGLTGQLDADSKAEPQLGINWDIVVAWHEQYRYLRPTEIEARDLVTAVTDSTHGVLQWIKRFW